MTEVTDLCGFGELPPEDPRALACDWTGLYATHYCRNPSWAPDVQDRLDAARTVAELREAWAPLAVAGETDSMGGGEYHHALAHLRWLSLEAVRP